MGLLVSGALIYGTLKQNKVKVIDLTETDIIKACDDLIVQFDCQFDLAIGIAEGGKFISETIAKKLNLPLLLVKRQRPLTNEKSRIKNIFKYIPKNLLNIARIAENRFYELSMNKKSREDKSAEIQMLTDDSSFFESFPVKNVLLIDDAVDSGSTILDVEKFFKPRHWNIKVAVITQTFNKPLKQADYKVYDKTLIRFPWSSDYRNVKKS